MRPLSSGLGMAAILVATPGRTSASRRGGRVRSGGPPAGSGSARCRAGPVPPAGEAGVPDAVLAAWWRAGAQHQAEDPEVEPGTPVLRRPRRPGGALAF